MSRQLGLPRCRSDVSLQLQFQLSILVLDRPHLAFKLVILLSHEPDLLQEGLLSHIHDMEVVVGLCSADFLLMVYRLPIRPDHLQLDLLG